MTTDDFTYRYRHPMVSVATDLVLLTLPPSGGLRVALVRREEGSDAFPGAWALPGGFLKAGEDPDLEACARRELLEEVGVEAPHLDLVGVYSALGRDPRSERVISVAYMGVLVTEAPDASPIPGTDVTEARWVPLTDLSGGTYEGRPLAFDHARILSDARCLLAERAPFGRREEGPPDMLFSFLPEEFTLGQAAEVMTHLRGERTDPSNLRKYLVPFVEPTGGAVRTSTRNAALYRRRGEEPDQALADLQDPSVMQDIITDLRKTAEKARIQLFDLFLATLTDATEDVMMGIAQIVSDYADHPEYDLSVSKAAELRIGDRTSGRPLLALRFQGRRGELVGTALARPDLLRGLRLTLLAPHRRGAHQSQFVLGQNAWYGVPQILERCRAELVIDREGPSDKGGIPE
jgi:8-oxo-dGTP diphosphatase